MEVELPRSRRGSRSRIAYFTDILISVTNDLGSYYRFRLDTGSTYTIVGTGMLDTETYNYIYNFGEQCFSRGVVDASGNVLRLIKLNVKEFRLTNDIVLNNMELFFSPDLGDKAVLGMDILSLFEFKYIHEKSQLIGTFYLINPKKSMDVLHNKYTIRGMSIQPRSIMLLDDLYNRYICISKEKKGNKVISYLILDKLTNTNKVFSSFEFRSFLNNNIVDNVTLTSDNKIKTNSDVKVYYT